MRFSAHKGFIHHPHPLLRPKGHRMFYYQLSGLLNRNYCFFVKESLLFEEELLLTLLTLTGLLQVGQELLLKQELMLIEKTTAGRKVYC